MAFPEAALARPPNLTYIKVAQLIDPESFTHVA
jgi:hypothetical protein